MKFSMRDLLIKYIIYLLSKENLKDMVKFIIKMGQSLWGNSKMVKQMDLGIMSISMEAAIEEML